MSVGLSSNRALEVIQRRLRLLRLEEHPRQVQAVDGGVAVELDRLLQRGLRLLVLALGGEQETEAEVGLVALGGLLDHGAVQPHRLVALVPLGHGAGLHQAPQRVLAAALLRVREELLRLLELALQDPDARPGEQRLAILRVVLQAPVNLLAGAVEDRLP